MADVSRDRGLSITLGYAITLAITALLVVGLVLASGAFESTQREQVAEDRLGSAGQRLAGEIEAVDRLNRSANGSIESDVSLPSTAADSPYRITVTAYDGQGTLDLSTSSPDVTVTVAVSTRGPVTNGTVAGGDLVVRTDGGAVEVVND